MKKIIKKVFTILVVGCLVVGFINTKNIDIQNNSINVETGNIYISLISTH